MSRAIGELAEVAGVRYWPASLGPALVGTTLPFWLSPPSFSFRWLGAAEFVVAAALCHAGFSLLLARFDGRATAAWSSGRLLGCAGACFLALVLLALHLGRGVPPTLFVTYGVATIFAGLLYVAPPFSFWRRAGGEIVIAFGLGMMPVLGAYLVQVGDLHRTVYLTSLPLVVATGLWVWVDELVTRDQDQRTGQGSLVLAFGPRFSTRVAMPALVLGLYATLLVAVLSGSASPFALLALLPGELARRIAVAAWQERPSVSTLERACARARRLHLSTAALIAGASLVPLVACSTSAADPDALRPIPLDELRDRVAGGWAGQMIGVTYGAPTEFRYLQRVIPDEELPEWRPEMVEGALGQDDLYVEMTFAAVLDAEGLDAPTASFGAAFAETEYPLWHGNLAARRGLRRGVPATLSGDPVHNAHAEDIDFQIESDFIGLMCPGLPQAASELARRVGRVVGHGDGVSGGIFVSGMYAAAFFESDPRRVVEAGLAGLPRESRYARVIADTLAWSRQHPGDWQAVWQLLQQKWDRDELCPEGALRPFGIDAALNGAYIALGLLHGGGDFAATMRIATRCGQDSDCNPSNACGILGVMLGYRRIPAVWTEGIPALGEREFRFTSYSYPEIVESTVQRAVEMVTRCGGRTDGERLWVRRQPPAAAEVELDGPRPVPVERIDAADPRWSWHGAWREHRQERRGATEATRTASARGASAEIVFRGTGVILCGPLLPTGGKAEIHLDGELQCIVDVHPDEDWAKTDEAVWHAFDLADAEHRLRLVVRGEPFVPGGGTEVAISDVIVFR